MPTATPVDVRRELHALADPGDAEFLQRFFKTGSGQYGEGDQFLGIRVPQLRALARRFRSLPREEVLDLLRSPWHEERLLSLLLLTEQYRRGSGAEREAIHQAYLSHTRYINNWDLVDSSAEHLVGAHLDLREVGKRDVEREEEFLREYYRRMPRTMLRYAIERLAEPRRQQYLQGQI